MTKTCGNCTHFFQAEYLCRECRENGISMCLHPTNFNQSGLRATAKSVCGRWEENRDQFYKKNSV